MRRMLYYKPGDDRDRLTQAIASSGWRVDVAEDLPTACRFLATHEYGTGLALLDERLDASAEEELAKLSDAEQHVEWVALLSPMAIKSPEIRRLVRTSFYDYHTLPADMGRLRTTLGRAHGMAELARSLAGAPLGAIREQEMVGVSPSIRAVFHQIRKMAPSSPPVLITGESGTGKELAARAIHQRSERASQPFVAINCGALPSNLIQSELFGHEKGAFTGAHQRRIGRIEAADGGTVFLDEIGDLPVELQVNLLRFLQENTIQRIGSPSELPVDVRVIAATNIDLEAAVEASQFREDLYFRLNVLHMQMPPLRDRVEDIEPLARYFFGTFSREKNRNVRDFSRTALQAMVEHAWPGNVREMINRIRRAMIMCEERLIGPQDLDLKPSCGLRPVGRMTLEEARAAAEAEQLHLALERTAGNLSEAARQLDVSRPTLYRLLEKFKLLH